ncbi:MAG: D-2-hydroxyacid dehydrogenase [Holophagaceae bacterium]
MPKLAVLHHRHLDWVPALREAAPDLDIRGWHPREWEAADREWLLDAEALFCWRIPPGFLELMPRLRWVQNSGAGVDHLVHDPAIPAHVPITRADGQFGFWMARYACGHLLAEAQRLRACAEAQAAATWNPKLLPEDLTDQRALVVGFGRIGRRIGRALRELGLEVHGVVRAAREDGEFPLHATAELAALLPTARALVLAAPSTPETTGMVGADLLARGHARLTLVNVGRGDLVDVQALLDALDLERLGHAVLDVFPEEPLPADSPLWRHPKVTVTPHHSGPSTPRQLIPDIQENLDRYARGEAIQGAVDRARGY